MRVHIASDHAGYELKAIAITHLENNGHEVIDHGALTYDPQDDYPSSVLKQPRPPLTTPAA